MNNFLLSILIRYELVVFTASIEVYGAAIADKLDVRTKLNVIRHKKIKHNLNVNKLNVIRLNYSLSNVAEILYWNIYLCNLLEINYINVDILLLHLLIIHHHFCEYFLD